MYLKFIEEYLICGRYFINISYYCLPPCLPIYYVNQCFKVMLLSWLVAGNRELDGSVFWMGIRSYFLSYFQKWFCRASFLFKPTLLPG